MLFNQYSLYFEYPENDEGLLEFKGDAEKSAEILFNSVCNINNSQSSKLKEENAELREMLKRNKKAFLNQIKLDLIRDSAKQETKELAGSIEKLINK